jgi:hypothetical protein
LEIFFLVDGIPGLDLFGDPIVERREGRGRPEHVWTLENSNKVLLAFARGLSVKQAAQAIGISAPTLRKVYFFEAAKRDQARLRMEMTQLARLNAQAEAGNVAAEKELFKQIDRLRLRDQAQSLSPQQTQPAAKLPRVGKKELERQAAEQVTGLYEPPPPPARMN